MIRPVLMRFQKIKLIEKMQSEGKLSTFNPQYSILNPKKINFIVVEMWFIEKCEGVTCPATRSSPKV